MNFGFVSKTQTAFGLDVSSSSLKVMQLGVGKKSAEVKGYAEAKIPKGTIIADAISDAKTFSYLLKSTLDKPVFGHIDTNYAVVSLPESKSFVRVIQIPKMSDSEAESAIPFEAESFIPLPIEQVYLDWQKLGETGDKMNILIIASPKEYVDKFLGVLDQVGIKTLALEVESQSCHRAIVAKDSRETSLIVDLSATHSSIIMVENGNLQFTSTVPIAGSSFTEALSKGLGVSSVKAEEIKSLVGMTNTPQYPNIRTYLLPVLTGLSAEIKNIIKFHSEHSAEPVSKIWLAGGTSKLKNLSEFLNIQFQDFSGLEVKLSNPWINLDHMKSPPLSEVDSLGYVTAIGLAMRGAGVS
jgi:type IV pilus assembly protein PilM